MTSTWPRPSTSTASRTARFPSCCCSRARRSSTSGGRCRSSRSPGTRRRRTGCRWPCGGRRWTSTSPTAPGSGCGATRSTISSGSSPASRCRRGTTRSRRCCAWPRPRERPAVSIETARRIADTVLYEGYILYPYRASHGKNASGVRWQFGVLVPRRHAEAHPLPAGALPEAGTVSGAVETWFQQTECIVEPGDGAGIDVRLRFLQLQARQVEEAAADGSFVAVESLTVGGRRLVTWDEGVETELPFTVALADLLAGERCFPVECPAGEEVEDFDGGRVTRRREALSVRLVVSAERLPGPYGVVRLRLRTENVTDWAGDAERRADALRHSPVATHLVIGATPGTR